MYRIAKEFSFSMGHRLACHDGLCKNFHGHNYKIIIGIRSKVLNPNGMVIDFGDVKAIGNHYFKQFDHAMMINRTDVDKFSKLRAEMPYLKVMIVEYEPTAENMAREIFNYFQDALSKYAGVACMDYVTIYETDKSKATYTDD